MAVVDPAGVTLGGEFEGVVVPAGTMFTAEGTYLVRRGLGRADIKIDYRSRGPMQPVGRGGAINCEVYHEKFGWGVSWGYFEMHPLDNGQIAPQVRNVLAFPAFGHEETKIQNEQ
ncbi:MAG: hypothetical protein ACI93R_001946 [Flavobacteriales bacterium]|jgi:hypothetical protein